MNLNDYTNTVKHAERIPFSKYLVPKRRENKWR